MILLGTSGFSYDDWIGPVYPPGLPQQDWLSYIANQLDVLELNVTYYRLPALHIVSGWVEKTPDDFLFSVKAHQSLTHERQNPDFAAFMAVLRPMQEAGKLACILAQFPHSFRPNPATQTYLYRMRDGLGDVPLVVEFRNRDWVSEATFALLEEIEAGYCCVDEPQIRGLMPPLAWACGSLAYVRFHGRNAAQWYNHQHAWQRYDYLYDEDELGEWVPKIRQLDQQVLRTLVLANNHYRGKSVVAMRQLRQLLGAGETPPAT